MYFTMILNSNVQGCHQKNFAEKGVRRGGGRRGGGRSGGGRRGGGRRVEGGGEVEETSFVTSFVTQSDSNFSNLFWVQILEGTHVTKFRVCWEQQNESA